MSPTHPPTPGTPPCFIVHIEVYLEGRLTQRLAFINKERLTFGRNPGSDVSFPMGERTVSSQHAELVLTSGGYMLRDAGSRNGVFLVSGGDPVRLQDLLLEAAVPPISISLGSPGPLCQISIGRVYPFADYLVTGQLGEGGMARVFAAQDSSALSRMVVLKILASRFLLSVDQDDAEAMLEEEARLVSQICHPNVVKIFKVDSHAGTPYIAMEYLHGVSLASIQLQLAARQVRCPYDLAAALVGQACRGLHSAHDARDASGRPLGIVHRDFTPSNIMCSPEGDVKLIDFGVARASGRRPWSMDSAFVGKAAYAAPEQINRPQEVDRRADLFAAGVIMHELLSGQPLFERETDYATMNAVMHDPIPAIAGIPDDVNALLHRALSRSPSERPDSAEQLAEELEALVLRTSGHYLQRKNIAHSLRRLGVSLEAPPPRALLGRPTVFPGDSASFAPRPQPQAPHRTIQEPPRESLPDDEDITARIPSVHQPLLVPNELWVAGQQIQLSQCLDEYTSAYDEMYSHVTMAGQILPTDEKQPQTPCAVLVHLFGAHRLLGPLSSQQQSVLNSFLNSFLEDWPALNHEAQPAQRAFTAAEAWPGGPQALIMPRPERLWSDVLSRESRAGLAPTKLAAGLLRGLLRMGERFPGFTLGDLSPMRVAILPSLDGSQGRQPQLLLGRWLDWLLSRAPSPLPAIERMPLDRAFYLAPECLRGQPPTSASDVFSAALMIYELLGGNLTAVAWALRQGGRLPRLPPSQLATPELWNGLLAALNAEPERRPCAAELLRLCLDPESAAADLLELRVPGSSELISSAPHEGRRVHLHSVLLERQASRSAGSLPFHGVPQLLPKDICLVRFRDGLAVELVDSDDSVLPHSRIYPENTHAGTERVFLSRGTGAFEIGSRSRNRLQRVDYHVLEGATSSAVELACHGLRIVSAPLPCAALLWTREPRSGDLHICCAQLAD